MKYGSAAAISELFSSGWVFVPAQRMACENRHVEEVFPRLRLEFLHLLLVGLRVVLVGVGDLLDGLLGPHVDRALALFHVQQHQIIAQVCRHGLDATVGLPVLEFGFALGHVVAAERIGRARLEQEEPGADRSVRVLEAHGNEPHFLARHLGARLQREVGGRAGVPGRIPRAAHALSGTARLEHVHRATHGREGRLGLEHVERVVAHREADRADAPVAVHQRPDDEHAFVDLADAGLQQRVLRRLGHDDLVGFAVDHQLPPAFVDEPARVVLPDGQAPLLEQVDRRVHVPGDVRDEILAGDPHEVVADVVHVVLDGVLAVPKADVLVDRGEPHRDGARAIDGGLVDERDLQPVLVRPVRGLHGGAARRHAAPEDQQVGFDHNSFKTGHVVSSSSAAGCRQPAGRAMPVR